ncbi:MAG: hypothetical protein RL199_713 [Pseudomonadota bacterium]|jgi:hypothetical protein
MPAGLEEPRPAIAHVTGRPAFGCQARPRGPDRPAPPRAPRSKSAEWHRRGAHRMEHIHMQAADQGGENINAAAGGSGLSLRSDGTLVQKHQDGRELRRFLIFFTTSEIRTCPSRTVSAHLRAQGHGTRKAHDRRAQAAGASVWAAQTRRQNQQRLPPLPRSEKGRRLRRCAPGVTAVVAQALASLDPRHPPC